MNSFINLPERIMASPTSYDIGNEEIVEFSGNEVNNNDLEYYEAPTMMPKGSSNEKSNNANGKSTLENDKYKCPSEANSKINGPHDSNKCKTLKKMLRKQKNTLDAMKEQLQYLVEQNEELSKKNEQQNKSIQEHKKAFRDLETKHKSMTEDLITKQRDDTAKLEKSVEQAILERNNELLKNKHDVNISILKDVHFSLEKFNCEFGVLHPGVEYSVKIDKNKSTLVLESGSKNSKIVGSLLPSTKRAEDLLKTDTSFEQKAEEEIVLCNFKISRKLYDVLFCIAEKSYDTMVQKAFSEIIGEETVLYMSATGKLDGQLRPAIPSNIIKSVKKIIDNSGSQPKISQTDIEEVIDNFIKKRCSEEGVALKLTNEQGKAALYRLMKLKLQGFP